MTIKCINIISLCENETNRFLNITLYLQHGENTSSIQIEKENFVKFCGNIKDDNTSEISVTYKSDENSSYLRTINFECCLEGHFSIEEFSTYPAMVGNYSFFTKV